MRLYILKLKNKPLYSIARLTRAILLDLDRFLHPAKPGKKHAHYDFQHQAALARDHCTFDNPAYSRAVQQLENFSAHLERIRFDAHGRAAQGDEFIRYSFFLLHEALESTHFDVMEQAWKTILASYKAHYGDSEKVIKALLDVEKRGRYKERSG